MKLLPRRTPSILLAIGFSIALVSQLFGYNIMEHWAVMCPGGILVMVQGALILLFAPEEAKVNKDILAGLQAKFPKQSFPTTNPVYQALSGLFIIIVGTFIFVIGVSHLIDGLFHQ
jgi:hypothetical protein